MVFFVCLCYILLLYLLLIVFYHNLFATHSSFLLVRVQQLTNFLLDGNNNRIVVIGVISHRLHIKDLPCALLQQFKVIDRDHF